MKSGESSQLTKNHKPLPKLGGDDEEEILPDGSLRRRPESLAASGRDGIMLQVVADVLSELMPQR